MALVNEVVGVAQSADLASRYDDTDLDPLQKLIPDADKDFGYMNATQLAKKCGLRSAQLNESVADGTRSSDKGSCNKHLAVE